MAESEVRSGLRHILSLPAVYNAQQALFGGHRWIQSVVDRVIKPLLFPGARILDIGCGTGEVVSALPTDVYYHGFDRNSKYIELAKARFASPTVTFSCMDVSDSDPEQRGSADVVLALGILHHLADQDCRQLFQLARHILPAGGNFITLDPVYLPDQSPMARWIISKDRGTQVRTPEGYKRLADPSLWQVDVNIDRSPLRIPFSGILMRCKAL